METKDIQPKAIISRNRQVDFALALIRTLGYEQAVIQCQEHHWHGTLAYVHKLGSDTQKFYAI